MQRALLTFGAAAALLVALAGCATAPSTGTVHGRVSLGAGAFDAPEASGAQARDCVTHAQSDDDLKACETQALAAHTVVGCTAVSPTIRPGTEIDVLDASDRVLAVGRLGHGRTGDSGRSCSYAFTASGVPSSGGVYGIRVGATGPAVAHFTKQEIFGKPAVITLG